MREVIEARNGEQAVCMGDERSARAAPLPRKHIIQSDRTSRRGRTWLSQWRRGRWRQPGTRRRSPRPAAQPSNSAPRKTAEEREMAGGDAVHAGVLAVTEEPADKVLACGLAVDLGATVALF